MVNCCMTDFSTCTMSTANNLSINDDSTADTCSKSYKNNVLSSAAAAFPCFAKCATLASFPALDGSPVSSVSSLVTSLKPQKRFTAHGTSPLLVNRSRYPDSHTVDFFFIQLTLCDLVKDCLCNIWQDCFSTVLLRV